jgi:hypothetical protein
MKALKFPSETGEQWWIVSHDLLLAEGRLRKLRPIHVFTHLAQYLVKSKPKHLGLLCLSLEAKLSGVRFQHIELRKAIAEVGDSIYEGKYVREYDAELKVISALEAYLNSIYTVLELVALINRILHPNLPIGFRKQSKKFGFFDFSKWDWLPHFYDVRSELTHFGSSLPRIDEGKVVIEFTSEKKLEKFEKGIFEIPFINIFNYSDRLFQMLDEWAKDELSMIDPEESIHTVLETGLNSPLKVEDIKIKDVLALLER